MDLNLNFMWMMIFRCADVSAASIFKIQKYFYYYVLGEDACLSAQV